MTFKQLMKAYYKGEPGPEGGVRAVVEALRNEMCSSPYPCISCARNEDFFTEILADSPDGVALISMEHPKGPKGALRGKRIRKDSLETIEIEVPDDVCEWTPISEMDSITHYSTAHGVKNDFHRRWRNNECPECSKPIKFKSEAAQ